KRIVEEIQTRANVGLGGYPLFAVGVIGKTPTTLDFTGDRDRVFAALDGLAKAERPGPTVFERRLAMEAACRQIPRISADADRFVKADRGYQALQHIGTLRNWEVVPSVIYFGPNLDTGAGVQFFLVSARDGCDAPNNLAKIASTIEWSDFVAINQPRV